MTGATWCAVVCRVDAQLARHRYGGRVANSRAHRKINCDRRAGGNRHDRVGLIPPILVNDSHGVGAREEFAQRCVRSICRGRTPRLIAVPRAVVVQIDKDLKARKSFVSHVTEAVAVAVVKHHAADGGGEQETCVQAAVHITGARQRERRGETHSTVGVAVVRIVAARILRRGNELAWQEEPQVSAPSPAGTSKR